MLTLLYQEMTAQRLLHLALKHNMQWTTMFSDSQFKSVELFFEGHWF